MNRIREVVELWLKTANFGAEWKSFEDACEDDFAGAPWRCGPKTKIINGKKVAVVLSREGRHHACWRLFADGKHVRDLPEVILQMGSASDAIKIAEREFGQDQV